MPKPRWYGKKTEKRWNKCLESPGRLAGTEKGTVQPDVCFASWLEVTPSGNSLCPVRSESIHRLPSKEQDGSVCQALFDHF